MGSLARNVVLILVLAQGSLLAGANEFHRALEAARTSRGLAIAAFVDPGCSAQVLSSLSDAELSRRIGPRRRAVLTASQTPLLAARFGATKLPLVVLLDPQGKEIGRSAGLRSAGALLGAVRTLIDVADKVMACRNRVQRDPADVEAWYFLGDYHWYRGERHRALECFHNVLELEGEASGPWADLVFRARQRVGEWLVGNNRLAEAEALLRVVPVETVSDQHASWVFLQLALVLHRRGRTEEAVALLRDSVDRWERSPRAARIRFTLGCLLYSRGRRDAALEHFQFLQEHFPHNVYGHRARRYVEQSSYRNRNSRSSRVISRSKLSEPATIESASFRFDS